MSDKRYPHATALNAANDILIRLAPFCHRIIIAGSLRRIKPDVGDIEILYIPRFEARKLDMFADENVNLADEAIGQMLSTGLLDTRLSKTGGISWGPKNKFGVHRPSGIPVDLFSATLGNWFNYLVCRTGPGESNIRICQAAQAKGWKWNPYGPGFSRVETVEGNAHNEHIVTSERDVFDFVGLPYLEPEERV